MSEDARRWGVWGAEWIDVTPMVTNEAVDYRAEDLPPGSVLWVDYKGERYTVYVVPPVPDNENGRWRYVYEGERYPTLSAIAALISGDRTMSGNRFFKLRRRRK